MTAIARPARKVGAFLKNAGLFVAAPFIVNMIILCNSRGATVGIAVALVAGVLLLSWRLRLRVALIALVAFPVVASLVDQRFIDRQLTLVQFMNEGLEGPQMQNDGAASERPLRDLFDAPDLAAMDDTILNGTRVLKPGEPAPLALFKAARIDYSLHRLRHYTGTSPEHFQNFIIFTNYQFYVDAFARIGRERMAADDPEYLAYVEPGDVVNIPNRQHEVFFVVGKLNPIAASRFTLGDRQRELGSGFVLPRDREIDVVTAVAMTPRNWFWSPRIGAAIANLVSPSLFPRYTFET